MIDGKYVILGHYDIQADNLTWTGLEKWHGNKVIQLIGIKEFKWIERGVCAWEKSIVQRGFFIRQTIFVPLKSHITYICMHTCIHQHFVENINKSVYIRTNCAHTYCIFRSKKSTNFIRMQYLPAQTYISPICDISHPRALSSASINFVSLWNYGRRILPMCNNRMKSDANQFIWAEVQF